MDGNSRDRPEILLPPTKRFRKIPVYVVEEHNNALEFIFSAIGGKRLPLEGTTLLHLDAHPDMLIDRKLKGVDARSGRKLLPLLQIENWIVPAAAAGHLGRVVWLRPPWAVQLADGSRPITVGDHPTTGLLRVDSTEPYYLFDALYSKQLENKRTFTLTVAELSDPSTSSDTSEHSITKLAEDLNIFQPYVLDIDLDFFSTGNPFLSIYDNIKLYDLLEPIFRMDLPEKLEEKSAEGLVKSREQHLDELENLFQHLEENGNLTSYKGEKSELFNEVSDLSAKVIQEAERLEQPPDWWTVYAAGCTRDQGGLPYHISSEDEIRSMVDKALKPLLESLPAPVMITVARSTEDGYCPNHQVELIQSLVLQTLKELYDTDEPVLHYLSVNTCTKVIPLLVREPCDPNVDRKIK